MADRRGELIEAGVSLLAQRRFQDLLSAVETRMIADEVGVTTGSFFHHFRNRAHFAAAVVDRFVQAWDRRVSHLRAASTGFIEEDGTTGVREATTSEWTALLGGGDTAAVQHLLWAVRDQPLSDETARTAGDVLRDCYQHLTDRVEAPYQEALRLMGREMLPPFTSHDLTVIMTAVEEGMQMRHGVDAAAIRTDLYIDTVSAILLGVTRPRVERSPATPAPELPGLETRFLIRRHDGRADGVPVETWRHIADSAAHLFVDRSPGDVRISEVAAAAGVTVDAVHHHFGTVTAVAAAGWARHVRELEALVAVPTTPDDDPIRRIEQVLLRAVELIRANRGAAEALLAQVIAEAAPDSGPRRGIGDVVPAAGLLVPLVAELRAAGRLRRGMETVRLSRSLVHVCTVQALVFAEESPGRIVDEVMTLVFDGALVAPSDA